MATAKQGRMSLFSFLLRLVAVLVVAGGVVWLVHGEQIRGFGSAGTAFAAQSTCACRYVAERPMDSCKTDLSSDMWAIWLSEDRDTRTVSASIPLVAVADATWREGYGCVLAD